MVSSQLGAQFSLHVILKFVTIFYRTLFDLILKCLWRQTNRTWGEGVKADICFGFVRVGVR